MLDYEKQVITEEEPCIRSHWVSVYIFSFPSVRQWVLEATLALVVCVILACFEPSLPNCPRISVEKEMPAQI